MTRIVPVAYYYGKRNVEFTPGKQINNSLTSAQLAVVPTNDKSTAPLKDTPIPFHDVSADNIAAAKIEIENFLGKTGIDDTIKTRESRASSAWSMGPPGSIADFVCFPTSTEEVSQIVKICHKRRIPITAFSGGTR